MTADVELLPCPFCGEKLQFGTVSEGSTFRWRKVDGCCADGPEVRHDTMADDQVAAEEDSRRRAIEAWNTREPDANLAPLQAENERLRAEVERLQSDTSFATAISSLRREKERAERLAEALRWAERHCPCGARPESPDTHPHVPGCLVGAALAQEDRNG